MSQELDSDQKQDPTINGWIGWLKQHVHNNHAQPVEHPRMHFNSEFDSNQTHFETLSNRLEIGVLSNASMRDVSILMRILRMIIDKRNDWPSFEQEIESCIEMNQGHIESFPISEPATAEMCNGLKIKAHFHQIDLWTAKRMLNAIDH